MMLAAKFAMPWAAAVVLLRCAAAAADECEASSAECEAASVLQTRRSSAGKGNKKSYEKMVSWEGNGWLAETDYVGIVVGLLNVLGKKQGSAGTLKTLFGQMDGFASTSGGSWFMGQMAYSAPFSKKVEDTAAQADSKTVGIEWIEGFVHGEDVSPAAGQTWQDWVIDVTMENQSWLPPDTLVGNPVQPWADGKLWVAASSLPATAKVYIQTARSLSRTAPAFSYTPDTPSGTKGFPPYVPVSFSIDLKARKNQDAQMPFTFCATSDCFNLTNVYSLQTGSSKTDTIQQHGPVLAEMFDQEFSQIGALPLSGVLASTSTAMSSFATTSASKFFQFPYVIYAAQSATKQPWRLGESLRLGMVNNFSQSLAHDAMAAGATLVMDGSYTSNCAVLHSWKSGAKKTLAVTNTENGDLWWIESAFGTQQNSHVANNLGSLIFQTMKKPYANFSLADVFTDYDVNASAINRRWNVVQNLWYGSVETETLGNVWAGVEDGRPIKLNVITVNSRLSFIEAQGNGTAFKTGFLFQALVEIITDPVNKKHTDFILSDFLELDASD